MDIVVLEILKRDLSELSRFLKRKASRLLSVNRKEKTTEVQSYLFSKAKDWTLEKAKAWFAKHQEKAVHERVSTILPFAVLEKIVDKPLRIRGIAIAAGMSRNFSIYTPEELQAFTNKPLAHLPTSRTLVFQMLSVSI